jgi:hypothetical protein
VEGLDVLDPRCVMKRSRALQLAKYAKFRLGLAEAVGKSAKAQVQGEEVKMSEVLDSLDTVGANAKATDEARGAFHHAVAAEKEHLAQVGPMIQALSEHLVSTLPPEQVEACGLSPKKARRVLSGEERAVKAVKTRKTREAKGTRGKRQIRAEETKAALAAAYAPDGAGIPPTPQPGQGPPRTSGGGGNAH